VEHQPDEADHDDHAQRSPLLASRPDALSHVGYFADLIDEWAAEGNPDERLFRLGTATLDAIAAGVPTGPLARYFEYWLLRLQGVYPPHVACHRCGVAIDRDDPGAWLEPNGHVFTCRSCAGGFDDEAPRGMRLSGPALSCLDAFGRTSPLDLASSGLPAGVDRELEAVHRALLRVHLEKDLRSARVLRDLRR
jgi:recombinational DNA repair protein (RecF pathway)